MLLPESEIFRKLSAESESAQSLGYLKFKEIASLSFQGERPSFDHEHHNSRSSSFDTAISNPISTFLSKSIESLDIYELNFGSNDLDISIAEGFDLTEFMGSQSSTIDKAR